MLRTFFLLAQPPLLARRGNPPLEQSLQLQSDPTAEIEAYHTSIRTLTQFFSPYLQATELQPLDDIIDRWPVFDYSRWVLLKEGLTHVNDRGPSPDPQ